MDSDRLVSERQRLLAMVDILEPLPSQEIERLSGLPSLRLQAREEFSLMEDRQALLILVSGKVWVYEANPQGEDLTISVIESGTVIGQTGFVPWRRRELRVQALQPSLIVRMEWQDFENLVRRYPEVGIRMIRLLSVRLGVDEDRLSDLTRKDVRARLASIIFKLSEYEGVVTSERGRKIPTRYTHRQLASMIGANREAVTKALMKLRQDGGVEVRDRYIHVVDLEKLKQAAE